MPLLDFVLKGGVRNSVKAASTMNAHLAALNCTYRLDEAVSVVVPVLAALRSGALAAGTRFRFVRLLRLLFRLLLLRRRLLLLLLRLRGCVTTPLERTRVCYHGLLRWNTGRLAARYAGCTGRLALLELDADALGDDVAEIDGSHRFAYQRIRGAAGAGECWTSSLQEARTRGGSREALGERGGSRLAVLTGTARRAGGLIGRNLQYRSALSAVAGFFLDIGIEVVVRHGHALLLLRLLMRGEGMVLMMMRLRLVSVHVLVQSLVFAHQLPHYFGYAIVSRIHTYVIITMSVVEIHEYLSM